MNPIYALMESPHRWLILFSISLGAAVLGAIMFVTWGWPHGLARAWFYLGLALAIYFGALAFIGWKQAVDSVPVSLDQGVEEGQR